MATFVDERLEEDATFPEIEPETQIPEDQITQEPLEDDIPEKYRGKSIKEVVEMAANAEKLMSKHSQEVGDLRNIVSQYVKRKSELAESAPAEEKVDFFEDPDKAMDQKLRNHPDVQKARDEAQLLRQERSRERVMQAHPDFNDVVTSPDFAKWITESPVRTELFLRADQEFDADAGMELIGTWKHLKGGAQTATEVAKEKRREEVIQGSTGSATGSSEPRARKRYRSVDLMKLRNEDPDRYDAMQNEILLAYAENRVDY